MISAAKRMHMSTDLRSNPALLKLELFCSGIVIEDGCDDLGRMKFERTRTGLDSGLEVILPGKLPANVPVAEEFARNSRYRLKRENHRHVIYKDGIQVAPVRMAGTPDWHNRRTTGGKLMCQIGTLQGAFLAIHPGPVCEYWRRKPKMNCKFCSAGLIRGSDLTGERSISDVVETVRAAIAVSRISCVEFNTGHVEGESYLDLIVPYVEAIKKETGILIGVKAPPHHDLKRYEHLKRIGVNRVSFCFEIYDEDLFVDICPGKHAQYGLKRYLDTIVSCARMFESCNGEIIAGLEPPGSSIKAIEWLTSVGAVPTVYVFRPLQGTDYEHLAPPRVEDLIPVYRRLYESCMERRLPIGVAPNAKTSLALMPEEARHLVGRSRRFWFLEARNGLADRAFRTLSITGFPRAAGKVVSAIASLRRPEREGRAP